MRFPKDSPTSEAELPSPAPWTMVLLDASAIEVFQSSASAPSTLSETTVWLRSRSSRAAIRARCSAAASLTSVVRRLSFFNAGRAARYWICASVTGVLFEAHGSGGGVEAAAHFRTHSATASGVDAEGLLLRSEMSAGAAADS